MLLRRTREPLTRYRCDITNSFILKSPYRNTCTPRPNSAYWRPPGDSPRSRPSPRNYSNVWKSLLVITLHSTLVCRLQATNRAERVDTSGDYYRPEREPRLRTRRRDAGEGPRSHHSVGEDQARPSIECQSGRAVRSVRPAVPHIPFPELLAGASLRVLYPLDDPSSPTDLAEQAGVHRSTVYRSLSPLQHRGIVYRDDGSFALNDEFEELATLARELAHHKKPEPSVSARRHLHHPLGVARRVLRPVRRTDRARRVPRDWPGAVPRV